MPEKDWGDWVQILTVQIHDFTRPWAIYCISAHLVRIIGRRGKPCTLMIPKVTPIDTMVSTNIFPGDKLLLPLITSSANLIANPDFPLPHWSRGYFGRPWETSPVGLQRPRSHRQFVLVVSPWPTANLPSILPGSN